LRQPRVTDSAMDLSEAQSGAWSGRTLIARTNPGGGEDGAIGAPDEGPGAIPTNETATKRETALASEL
jgi:hypothetical protein